MRQELIDLALMLAWIAFSAMLGMLIARALV